MSRSDRPLSSQGRVEIGASRYRISRLSVVFMLRYVTLVSPTVNRGLRMDAAGIGCVIERTDAWCLSSKLGRPNRRRSTGRVGRVGPWEPDRTVWPTARLSVAGTPVPTYYDGFPKAPPTPPALSAVLTVGSRTRVARLW